MSLKAPAGQTVVQVSSPYRSASTSLSVVTAETSLAVVDASTWREALALVNCTAIASTTGAATLTVRFYNLDQFGNRYPDAAFLVKTITAVSKSRDQITAPIGSTIEVTYQLSTTGTGPSATFTVETQFKSA